MASRNPIIVADSDARLCREKQKSSVSEGFFFQMIKFSVIVANSDVEFCKEMQNFVFPSEVFWVIYV